MTNEYDYFIRSLKEGEELVEVVRRFWLVYFWQILLGLILLVTPFFLLYLLVQWGWWGLIGFGTSVFFGITILVRVVFQWSRNACVITSLRVIEVRQKGFFSKSTAEASYEKIQDVVSVIKGVMPTIFHYGTVLIQTASASTVLELDHVRDPERVKDIISDWQARSGKSQMQSNPDTEQAKFILKNLKNKIGEEELRKLVEEE